MSYNNRNNNGRMNRGRGGYGNGRNGRRGRRNDRPSQFNNAPLEDEKTKEQRQEEIKQQKQKDLERAEKLKNMDNYKDALNIPDKDTRKQTDDVKGTMDSFTDLALKTEIEMGLLEYGFEKPTKIQERAIPQALLGKDILARAKNGTGKTASFVIPILQKIDTTNDSIQAVIIVPIRELALQIADVFNRIGKFLKIEVMSSIGGSSVKDDYIRLNKTVHIIVATPGRLKDLIDTKKANMDSVRFVVLDEADKLLSEDYDKAVIDIVRMFKQRKEKDRPQIMLFSATFPESVETFCDNYLNQNNIENISPLEELTLKGVTQYYAYIKEKVKVKMLQHLFKNLNINQSIIFCNSKQRVELLTKKLQDLGFQCLYIHAAMAQKERNQVFHDFKAGKCRNLVSTDVFTRGIDNQNVNVVINFDFPRKHDSYLHRIGRSGRYGHLGIAINFVTEPDLESYHMIVDQLDATIEKIPNQIDENLYR